MTCLFAFRDVYAFTFVSLPVVKQTCYLYSPISHMTHVSQGALECVKHSFFLKFEHTTNPS